MRPLLCTVAGAAVALAGVVVSMHSEAADTPRPIHRLGKAKPPQCIQGYVWREAYVGDVVCVDPPRRAAVHSENELAASRVQPGGGAYGPDTCISGFVWREARPADHVCVTPDSRTQVARENAQASKLWSACGSPDNCARMAAAKQARVDELRARLAQRKRDLDKARADQRAVMERLRKEDEEWAQSHPGLGRSTQPSIADNVSPIEQDIREIEVALKDAERDAAQARQPGKP